MPINNKYVVHEGVIKDIVDILSDKEFIKKAKNKLPFFKDKDKTYIPNIAKATSDLVLTFPVIVDESVDLASAKIIAKSVEQRMVSMLQMLFAAIDITNNQNAFDFIDPQESPVDISKAKSIKLSKVTRYAVVSLHSDDIYLQKKGKIKVEVMK